MIKSKNPSQHNTPHQEARQRASAVARRHRAPRDNTHTIIHHHYIQYNKTVDPS
jgi:hypothetical protein